MCLACETLHPFIATSVFLCLFFLVALSPFWGGVRREKEDNLWAVVPVISGLVQLVLWGLKAWSVGLGPQASVSGSKTCASVCKSSLNSCGKSKS